MKPIITESWVEEQLTRYNRLMGHAMGPPMGPPSEGDPGPESDLQKKIVSWAREHGFPCLSFPQTSKVKRFLPAGWPDVTLLLEGRVVFIELKAGKKDLREKQVDFQLKCMHLGLEFYKINSFKQFLDVVNK